MTNVLMGSRVGISRRQGKIIELLRAHGTLSISDVATRLSCSTATIRRDIQGLEEQGEVRRLHGAVALDGMVVERPFQDKFTTHPEEKKDIAACLAEWMPDGAIVGLNGGTTTTAVALRLAELQRNITVVTNAVNIAHTLSDRGIPVVVVGGALRPQNYETTGPAALASLAQLHLDWAVLGANGIDRKFGITTTTEDEAAVGQAFAKQADHVLVAGDRSKLGRTALFRMLLWNELDFLCSDNGARSLLEDWGLSMVEEGIWSLDGGGPRQSGG
jgi:DeoR family transcriptional regulator of aga operon